MTALPFGLGTYSRGSDRLPPVRLVNLYAEQTPTAPGGVALIQRPGLNPLYSLSGQARGFYQQAGVLNGDLFNVQGATVYRNGVAKGSIGGTDLTEWAYTGEGLFVLSGGVIYKSTDGESFAPDAFPDEAAVNSITALDGILVAVRRDVGAVYYRLPGETAWNGLDLFFGEREPDPTISVRAVGDELWLFGSTSIEPFYPTGNSDGPFTRLDGRAIQRGLKARDAVALLDNSVFWAGEDAKVYRGPQGSRISNHGIEERVEASTRCVLWTYCAAGHDFLVMTLDAETLVYDAATNEWHQARLDGSSVFGTIGYYASGIAYLGKTGGVFTLTDRATDDGAPIERIWTSVTPVEAPVACHCIEVGVSTGTSPLGSPATVQLRWSDDQGRTWSDWIDDSLGDEGEFRKRVRYRRLGMIDAPGRLFEHRVTDPAIIRVSNVEMNPAGGGRGR